MTTPVLFGFPLYVGLKRRVAKKHINMFGDRRTWKRFLALDGFKIGDLVSTCDGLNSRVVRVKPWYIRVGLGKVLCDLDVDTDRNWCSVYHCGVGPPITFEAAVQYRDNIMRRYPLGHEYGFHERYSKMTINPDGTYTRGV